MQGQEAGKQPVSFLHNFNNLNQVTDFYVISFGLGSLRASEPSTVQSPTFSRTKMEYVQTFEVEATLATPDLLSRTKRNGCS
jgi:hypothetical protein